jgi:hypothetical protein
MRCGRAPAAALAAVLSSACSLVVSLDGLSGGPAGPENDAASTVPDGALSDAVVGDDATNPGDGSLDGLAADAASGPDTAGPRDALGPDSPGAPDAAGDSASAGDAGLDAVSDVRDGAPGPFCASLSPQPSFCADFDEGSATSGWSYVHMMGGTIALDGTEFRSAPGAMITQSGIAGSGLIDVAGYRSFAMKGPSTFTGTVNLDIRVDQADATGGLAVLAQIGLIDGTGGGQYFVQFVMNSHGAAPLDCSVNEIYFAAGMTSTPVRHPVAPTIAIGAWTHLTLSITAPFPGGAGTQTLSFNGVQAGTSSISVPVRNFSETLGVGLTFVQTPSNGWTAAFDNVTFDATAL